MLKVQCSGTIAREKDDEKHLHLDPVRVSNNTNSLKNSAFPYPENIRGRFVRFTRVDRKKLEWAKEQNLINEQRRTKRSIGPELAKWRRKQVKIINPKV